MKKSKGNIRKYISQKELYDVIHDYGIVLYKRNVVLFLRKFELGWDIPEVGSGNNIHKYYTKKRVKRIIDLLMKSPTAKLDTSKKNFMKFEDIWNELPKI